MSTGGVHYGLGEAGFPQRKEHAMNTSGPLDPKALAERSIADLISLKGRRAVITGGARGLGLAIGRRLAEAGASVMIGDKNEPGASEAAKVIAKTFEVDAYASTLDVAASKSMARFAEAADKALGGIDIWVNNAGTFPAATMTDISDEDWDLVNNINLRGTFYGCREAGRRMEQVGRGVIVNITSVAGYRGRSSLAHYNAAKHGVVGLAKSAAMELGPKGVRVVCVAPAMTETPGLEEQRARYTSNTNAAQAFREMEQKILATLPLRRFGHPDDIARVVVFVASDMAAFVTATTVFCDGGISAF
jgi:NAD(P)-dependent dehydrogenase (short-subunit alcohol dehydrogenase family)